jgi:hypothetical protein
MRDSDRLKIALQALEDIRHPLQYLQRKAEEGGNKLNGGMVIRITEDCQLYKDIASEAINTINNEK